MENLAFSLTSAPPTNHSPHRLSLGSALAHPRGGHEDQVMFSRKVTSTFFVTPWTAARQAPLSVGFSRQEHWSGLPFSPPGNLSRTGVEPVSPALAGRFFTTEPFEDQGSL